MTRTAPGAKNKIWLIDFDDSFTYNICSELYERGAAVQVVHWSKWNQLFEKIIDSPERLALILGPGPGHPSEYELSGLGQLHGKNNIFVFGVCLGHQLIWQEKGLEIKRCKQPVHGQQVEIEVPKWFSFLPRQVQERSTRVQRYNSLCVVADLKKMPPNTDTLVQHEELLASRFENTLTYQFHPESVGTSFRKSFFTPLLDFFV